MTKEAVVVRPSRPEDLPLLEQELPSPSRASLHGARHARQREGAAAHLIAWAGKVPVGALEVRWEEDESAEIRSAHPSCAVIHGLEVAPGWRSRGIGRALVAAAESAAGARGIEEVGLGVALDNVRARALYERLGYRDSGLVYVARWSYVARDGAWRHIGDRCVFLIRSIPPSA